MGQHKNKSHNTNTKFCSKNANQAITETNSAYASVQTAVGQGWSIGKKFKLLKIR